MPAPAAAVPVVVTRDRWHSIAALLALTKPRVVVMVVASTVVGYHLGLLDQPDYRLAFHLVVGTLLAAGGTLALNQYSEREVDARMVRTRERPLPAGTLTARQALVFGTGLTVLGLGELAAFVNVTAAAVTAVTAALYLFVYTPLKLRTPLCTLFGAVPGALPPVTGWVAARGELGLGAWVLFAILYLWQLPHTLAIARLYTDDYARAGIRVLPVVDPTGGSTERHAVAGSLALLAVSLLPTLIGLTGPVYFTGAFLAGVVLATVGTLQAITPSSLAARRLLLASLLYLPVVLALLAFDKV